MGVALVDSDDKGKNLGTFVDQVLEGKDDELAKTITKFDK